MYVYGSSNADQHYMMCMCMAALMLISLPSVSDPMLTRDMQIMLYFFAYYAMPQCLLLGPIMLQKCCHEMIMFEVLINMGISVHYNRLQVIF